MNAVPSPTPAERALEAPPIEFIVDRPFLLMRRDEQTGTNLFVGTIKQP